MNTVADPVPQLDQVDALIKSIRIPPRPSLLADMQRELASEDPSPEAIGKIVASDVGMSAPCSSWPIRRSTAAAARPSRSSRRSCSWASTRSRP
jgi:hypothetical protein